jgi:hypothetical protein
MDNVPVHVNNSANAGRPATHPSQGSVNHARKPKRSKKFTSMIIGIVVLLLALGAGGWYLYQSTTNALIDSSKYQAVFFTSGQVYFGKLQQVNRDYFKLTDVFYIQAPKNSTTSSTDPQKASIDKNSDLQLIKLGSEVHGPEDEMVINKSQVLFFENLKKDGTVTVSIDKFLSQKK